MDGWRIHASHIIEAGMISGPAVGIIFLMKSKFVWLGIFTGLSVLLGGYYLRGNPWLVFNLYMTASTSFMALPHEPLIFLYGKNHGIFITALMAVPPTIAGCYLDYTLLRPVLSGKYMTGIRKYPYYVRIAGWFNKLPFLTVLLAAATPVPFYPVRLLSISENYNRHCYTSAVTLGRLPRFLLIASGAKIWQISDNNILVILAIMIIWYICLLIYKRRILF